MKISMTQFQEHCLDILRRVERTGVPVAITRRGKVVARLSRPAESKRQAAARKRLKELRKTAWVGDVTSPSGEAWDAELGRY